MIRKLLCCFGWHEWEIWQKGFTGYFGEVEICKHCGEIKE